MNEHDRAVSRAPADRAMMAIDIVAFGDPSRTDMVQAHLRKSLYRMVREAFTDSDVPWNECLHEDRGDGILILTSPEVDPSLLVGPVLLHLAAAVRRHNRTSSKAAQIRLRIAVHAGRVLADDFGVTGDAVIHMFRLLDARLFKEAVRVADGDVGLVVSDYFYDSVVRHGLGMLDPADFTPVKIQVKESRARAWVNIPGSSAASLGMIIPQDQGGLGGR